MSRTNENRYFNVLAHVEHKNFILILLCWGMLATLLGSNFLWTMAYMRAINPVMLHVNPAGAIDDEPTDSLLQYVAWECARPYATLDSHAVVENEEAAKRWMTDRCIQAYDLALADFEKRNNLSFVQYLRDKKLGTDFEQVQARKSAVEGSGDQKRYKVNVWGLMTLLSASRGPLSTAPFQYEITLVRVAPTDAYPFGVKVDAIAPVGDSPVDAKLDGLGAVGGATEASTEPEHDAN